MNDQIWMRRREIDAIDEKLLTLINRRARLATEIGIVKKRSHAPLCDPDREQEVLARVSESSRGPLNHHGIKRIFKTIIEESRRIQSIENLPKTTSGSATPKWNRVSIIGCGLIGASFALALRKSGTCRRIAGWDTAVEVREEALRRGVIDEVDSFADGAISQSDLIYLAMPISDIIDFFREGGQQMNVGTVVTDSGSTKLAICRAAREHLPGGVVFVGGHPIAGSEHSGLAYSNAELFSDAPYVLVTDDKQTDQVRSLSQTLNLIGARVTFMTAEEHDRALALISHLPQLISSSLASTLIDQADAGPLLNLSGTGFRDMTRLAGSPWSMWRDILETNHAPIGKALDACARKLELMLSEINSLSEGQRGGMIETEKLFSEANTLAGSSSIQANRSEVIEL